MPELLMGDCKAKSSATFTAGGSAVGNSKAQALDRARAQAQTLLDAQQDAYTACPRGCPVKGLETDPDFDAGQPAYADVADAPGIFRCSVQQARVVYVACDTDGSTDGGGDPGGGTSDTGTSTEP